MPCSPETPLIESLIRIYKPKNGKNPNGHHTPREDQLVDLTGSTSRRATPNQIDQAIHPDIKKQP